MMKLFHIADLHIGKCVNEFNMIDDQKYILEQILRIIDEEKSNGVPIAGDVHDRSQPSVEAVELLDEFLTELTVFEQPVFMISGNHDFLERLSLESCIMQKNGLYITGVFDGVLQKVSPGDEHGIINICLLPFVKPAMVKPFFEQPTLVVLAVRSHLICIISHVIELKEQMDRQVVIQKDSNGSTIHLKIEQYFYMNGRLEK
jgi:exonuclease SbcD